MPKPWEMGDTRPAQNPWETGPSEVSPRQESRNRTPTGKPWERATAPTPQAGKPWQKAVQDPIVLEENTLFGRGQAQTVVGEFGAGLQQGARQVWSTLPAIQALAVQAYGDITGEDQSKLAMEYINESLAVAEGGAKRGVPRVEDIELNSWDWLKYVAGTLGEAVPFVASIMAGGGLAGGARMLALKMAQKGVPASTRATILRSIPAEIVGSTATAIGVETGATAQELAKAIGSVEPTAALAAGTIKGAAESVFPLMLGHTLKLTGKQTTELMDRVLTANSAKSRIALATGVEAGTETFQEEVDLITRDYMDENFQYLGPEAMSRRLNAFVAGGVGGAGLSTLAEGIREKDPAQADKRVSDYRVKLAAGDVPLVTGQGDFELPTSGPEDMVLKLPDGLDAGAAAANAVEREQALADYEPARRGLYAPIIAGFEPTFGTQDQASNDAQVYGGQGFLRLDPSKVRRGDVTVSVEDLPDTLDSPRISYLNSNTVSEATEAMVEAVKHKAAAVRAKSGLQTEENLKKAGAAYRRAIDLGVRVEPFADSQVILRDPSKVNDLAISEENVQSQLSEAGLAETIKLSDEQQYGVFRKGTIERTENTPVKGRRLDLEKVNPEALTGVPDGDLVQRVLASHEVSRNLSLGRARGLGINFLPGTSQRLRERLLRQFVRLAQSVNSSANFSEQSGAVKKRYLQLVNQGLRVDVTPASNEFLVLGKVSDLALSVPKEDVGPTVTKDQGTGRVRSPRAKQRDPRVSRHVQFYDTDTRLVFMSQFHHQELQDMLVGRVGGGKNQGDFKAQVSPLGNMLRQIVKGLGVQTDYVLEIVPPKVMPDRGVKFEDKPIQLKEGAKPQRRSVIMINPWYYAVPTAGGKKLIAPPDTYILKGTGRYSLQSIVPQSKKRKKAVRLRDGTLTTIGEAADAAGAKPPQLAITFEAGTDWASIPVLDRFETREEFQTRYAEQLASEFMIPGSGGDTKALLDWASTPMNENKPAPKSTPRKSPIGRRAARLGTGDSKLIAQNDQLAEFFADFSAAVGETIVAYEWGRTPADVQDLIKSAYRREKHLQEGLHDKTKAARTIAHPILQRMLNGGRGPYQKEYEFEEWLVHHISRYFVQPGQEHGPVAKFFRSTGKTVGLTIQRLWERFKSKVAPFKSDPLGGAPNQVVENWMDQLQLRGLENVDEPFLSRSTREQLIKSINKNRKHFQDIGISDYVVASPEKASTYQIRELLKILDGKDLPAKKKLEGLLAASDKHNTAMEWLLGIHQMSDMNPHIKGLKTYTSLTRAMENTAISWATMADKRIRQAQKLGKTQTNALWALMNDLDRMVYIDPAKLKEGVEKPRWPTAEELLALVKKHDIKRPTFEVYADIRNDYLQFLSYLEQVSVQQARETITDQEALAARIKEIRGETSQLRSRPYFPHMRFGKFALTVRGNDGKVVHFETFNTRKDREQASIELAKRFGVPKNGTIVEDVLIDHQQQWQGLPRYALRNVAKMLGLDGPDLTTQQRKDKALLEAMAVEALPTTSFRRNLINRRNVPGYSMDGMRAYANYFGRAARFMARMEYADRMELAIQEVKESGSPVSRDKRTRIADFMTRHYESQMSMASDWAEVRGLGFLWYFAFAPAAAFVNMTQVPLVAVPFLASKFGDLKTMGNVTKAYLDNTKEYFGWLSGEEVADTPKNEAIEEAHFSRLIDDGFATELAAISQGPVLQTTIAGSGFARGVRRVAQWGTLPFSTAEKINRGVTFRAAYDMALRDNGLSWIDEVMEANKAEVDQLRIDRGWDERHLRAYMAAAETVRKTQFEYGRWSRPKLMEGPRGVLFMFKTYLQNMLYYMFKSDRGTQVRYMLLMMGTAGIMGLPGADDASELVKWLAKAMGHRFDLREELRTLMVEWGADDAIAPDLMLHGASRYGFGVPQAMSGLGIPVPDVDLSGALSMGRLIPGLKEGLNPGSGYGRDTVGNIVTEVAGPVFGVPFAMYQSLIDSSLPAEDPKRWERAMPRAMKAVSRASRYLAEQRERDRSGATVLEFDPNDLNDQATLLGVGLGFQPRELSQEWDYRRAQMEAQMYWTGQRKILLDEYYRAFRLNDKEGKEAAIQQVLKYNKEVPEKSLRISGDTISRSVTRKLQNKELKELDIPRNKYLRGISQQVQTLYPEINRERLPKQ